MTTAGATTGSDYRTTGKTEKVFDRMDGIEQNRKERYR